MHSTNFADSLRAVVGEQDEPNRHSAPKGTRLDFVTAKEL
jgi:hypothetical protein